MKLIKNFKDYLRYLKVGSFLARRQISRGSIWITLLIIAIMTLTFLSLVVIPGILVGIIQGSSEQNEEIHCYEGKQEVAPDLIRQIHQHTSTSGL